MAEFDVWNKSILCEYMAAYCGIQKYTLCPVFYVAKYVTITNWYSNSENGQCVLERMAEGIFIIYSEA